MRTYYWPIVDERLGSLGTTAFRVRDERPNYLGQRGRLMWPWNTKIRPLTAGADVLAAMRQVTRME